MFASGTNYFSVRRKSCRDFENSGPGAKDRATLGAYSHYIHILLYTQGNTQDGARRAKEVDLPILTLTYFKKLTHHQTDATRSQQTRTTPPGRNQKTTTATDSSLNPAGNQDSTSEPKMQAIRSTTLPPTPRTSV